MTNNGPDLLPAGALVTVELSSDINLINAALPEVGEINLIQTGGTTLLSYLVPAGVLAGGEVFTQDLVYNPVAVTLNITDTTTQSSISAALSPSSQDTDIADNGDFITSPVGVLLKVATSDVQAILASWQQFIDDAVDFYELVAPFLPEVDWLEIIGGILEVP